MAESIQVNLENGQIATILPYEQSDEIINLFRQHFPRHSVSAEIDQTVMMIVYPPLREQEHTRWRNALMAHYTAGVSPSVSAASANT